MMRPFLLSCALLAACSPEADRRPVQDPAESGEGKQAPPAETEAVPFKKLGWDSATGRFLLEEKPFTGVTTDFYKPPGELKARYHVQEGVYHGLVEEWYENGQQKTKTSYEHGKHQGDNFYWNADGTLQVHKVWKDDVLVSETPGGKP